MNDEELNRRLSSISTLWTVVVRAHQDGADQAMAARRQLLERYLVPVYRYLLGALRDGDAADELFQEFALRFVRGDFKRADPEKGRFRDFVKTSLVHLVLNHQQRQRRPQPLPLAEDIAEPAAPDLDHDEEFTQRWRDELLRGAWSALQAFEQQSGKPYFAVLQLRAEKPELSSAEMAEQLRTRLGRALRADALRQTLHRAREKFAELLIGEVAASLQTEDPERVEQELLDLGLFSYCRGVWKRRDGSPGNPR
jgi:RNA polymerase sigma-70 factor (ECF subfamily)